MRISRLLQRFKMCLTCLTVLLILSVLSVIFYLHSIGLPAFVRDFIQEEAKKRDIFITFDTLKYKLNKGLVVEGVTYYKSKTFETPIFTSESLFLDIDKTKLLRAVVEVDAGSIENANVSLPIVNDIPNAPQLDIQNIGGSFSLSNQQQLESIDGISATIEGFEVVVKGRFWNTPSKKVKKYIKPTLEQQQAKVDQFNNIKEHLQKVHWKSGNPTLVVEINGNLADQNDLDINFKLTAPDLAYNEACIHNILVEGSYNRKLATFKTISFEDDLGQFTAHADLSFTNHKGHFSVDSSIDFKHFIDEFFGKGFAKDVTFSGKNKITAEGNYILPHTDKHGIYHKAYVHLLGKAEMRDVSYLEAKFDYLGTDFSWKKDSLFLDKLQGYHENGEFNGRLLMGKHEIKFSSNSSLPPTLFMPFLEGRGLDKTLKQLELSEDSRVNLSANGTINKKDLTDWKATGDLYLSELAYRDTYIVDASLDFDMSSKEESIYSNIEVNFDHSNWHKNDNSDNEGFAKVEKIHVSKDQLGRNLVQVTGGEGRFWLAPVVRMFDARAGQDIEKMHFTSPAHFYKSSGVFNFKRPFFHTRIDLKVKEVEMSNHKITEGSGHIDLKKGKTSISDFKAHIDYSKYSKEKDGKFNTDGEVSIDAVDVLYAKDTKNQTIIIDGIKGMVWPAAVTEMFDPKAAKQIDKTMAFTSPLESLNSTIIIKELEKRKKWATTYQLDCGTFSYNNVPFKRGKTTVSLLEPYTVFLDTELEFDLRDSVDRKSHGGPENNVAKVERVILGKDETVEIYNFTGSVWPGQVTSLFSASTAQTLRDLDFTSPVNSLGSDLKINYSDNWKTAANFRLASFSYNKVPLLSANLQMIIDPQKAIFNKVTAQFNNLNYALRKKYKGPSSSIAKVDQVTMDFETDLVEINNLRGSFWPAPALRLFSNDVAEELEEFRFTRPPTSVTNGFYDLKDNGTRTSLTSKITSLSPILYDFLDEDITITSASATVKTTSNLVQASSIKADLLGAKTAVLKKTPLNGWIKYFYNRKNPYFDGYLAWNDLSIAAIGKTYDIKKLDKGKLSGFLQFKITPDGVKTLNGKGICDIKEGNLANIPIVGPLSLILGEIGKTINNERLGYARIQKAFANFTIKNGVLYTNDLVASSTSVSLKGKGSVNLDNNRVDMKVELSKLSKLLSPAEIVRAVVEKIPIINGTVKYKVYGKADDLSILPAPN